MSNDPPHPPSDPEKIIGKTPKQAKEATEIDLWDLDSDDSDFVPPAEAPPAEPAGLPVRRKSGSSTLPSQKPSVRNINIPAMEELDAVEPHPVKPEEKPAPAPEDTMEQPKGEAQARDESGGKKEIPAETRSQPEAKPVIASLSKVEKIAISCLFAALALGATLTLIHFWNRVPTRPLVVEEIDYPVTGEIVEITAASTYWRTPVTTGENADVVRRGTQLIPVVKLSLNANSGAIRVFFRNEEGVVVGDGITRTIKGETELTIAATAGFEDIGMHTAYRTGDSLPWVVQVFEGTDAAAPREKFRKVLETEISTTIR